MTIDAPAPQKLTAATPLTERIVSLDVLRGFAILGILIVNIQAFSMPQAAYMNPSAYGDLDGINKLVWMFTHIFADQKFMTIFATLFGAGVVLFTQRARAKGSKEAGLHYSRTFWLIVIGMIHAYGLWYGDILVAYGICALVAFLFRNVAPKKLMIAGFFIIMMPSLIYLFFGASIQFAPPEAIADLKKTWSPDAQAIADELAIYRGSWLDQMPHRAKATVGFQTFIFLIWGGWRSLGLMLFGMGLFKWNVLSAQRSKKFYTLGALIGAGIGLPIVILGVIKNTAAGWPLEYSMFFGFQYNYWGSLGVSYAYVCAVMLICMTGALPAVQKALAGIGSTALSNYLFQTLICTFIFYGQGFGLFGHFDRLAQFGVVLGVWAIQFIVTPIWLKRFRFGPAEWLWRSLTYRKLQPIRRA